MIIYKCRECGQWTECDKHCDGSNEICACDECYFTHSASSLKCNTRKLTDVEVIAMEL
jgi:hypothetical protein